MKVEKGQESSTQILPFICNSLKHLIRRGGRRMWVPSWAALVASRFPLSSSLQTLDVWELVGGIRTCCWNVKGVMMMCQSCLIYSRGNCILKTLLWKTWGSLNAQPHTRMPCSRFLQMARPPYPAVPARFRLTVPDFCAIFIIIFFNLPSRRNFFLFLALE